MGQGGGERGGGGSVLGFRILQEIVAGGLRWEHEGGDQPGGSGVLWVASEAVGRH